MESEDPCIQSPSSEYYKSHMQPFNIESTKNNKKDISMAFPISLISKSLSFNHTVIDSAEYVKDTAVMNGETYQRDRIDMHVRPYQRMRCRFPKCMEKRPVYDHKSKT